MWLQFSRGGDSLLLHILSFINAIPLIISCFVLLCDGELQQQQQQQQVIQHRTKAASEKHQDLWCFQCDTMQHGDKCLHLAAIKSNTINIRPSIYANSSGAATTTKALSTTFDDHHHPSSNSNHNNNNNNRLSMNQLHHKCSKEQKQCVVRKITMSVMTKSDPQLATPKLWLLQRHCAEHCEPGCTVIGERTKLYSCITCCAQENYCNVGNSASNNGIYSHRIVLKISGYLMVILLTLTCC